MAIGLWFGADADKNPDGHDGKFEFQATIDVYITGKGVNEVREMTITATKKTDVEQVD